MNKVFIGIALVAAFAAASIAFPSTKVVNWEDVRAKVNEMRGVVRRNNVNITLVANRDNVLVGASISLKMATAGAEEALVFEQLNVSIRNESLTEDEARTQIGSLRGTIGRTIGSISMDLAKLTAEAETEIRAIFKNIFDTITVLADELYLLLQDDVATTTPQEATSV